MKNDLKPLTVITGGSFTGKTELLNKISKETNGKYINFNKQFDFTVTEELKHWFKFVFGIDFIEFAKSAIDSNYILRILSVGLNCKEGDVLVVENPETNLHPKAISNIAKFFVYLVSKKSVKVVIETNSTDFVTSVCYEVYVSNIYCKKVMFLNKADKDSIEKVFVDDYGKFVDDNGNLRKYSSGFFDANTDEVFALL